MLVNGEPAVVQFMQDFLQLQGLSVEAYHGIDKAAQSFADEPGYSAEAGSCR